MRFHSTKDYGHHVGLAEAVLRGLPPDNGLYMPEKIKPLPLDFWAAVPGMDFAEIAFSMTEALVGDQVPREALRGIVERACQFDAPLVKVGDRYVLELFHGPTLAFKDFGARFMAQLMAWLTRNDEEELHILVATSGDTGGAVAAGFHQVPGIRVTILYPEGKVSPLQKLQLTTWGDNIEAISVRGVFDDCQAMVKQAFLDQDLQGKLRLSSANSINIARLIPQSWYYVRAWQQLPTREHAPVFCVPSGNFGNLTGGVFAQRLGLPVHRFIAATNANDVVPTFLATGKYLPRASVATMSNAMDVGNPSNVARLQALWGIHAEAWRSVMEGNAVSDEDTLQTIRETWRKHRYHLDPHGAVGWATLNTHRQTWRQHPAVLLETAHPAKFPEVMAQALSEAAPESAALNRLKELQQYHISMDASFTDFKSYLLDRT